MVAKGSNKLTSPGGAQHSASIQNNFIGGLKTEFTGLNFPENACTSTENCVFTLIGDVTRRNGIDFEINFTSSNLGQSLVQNSSVAINTYKWNNAGGDGTTQILVAQVGGTLFFYQTTNATAASPLSTTLLGTVGSGGDYIQLSTFQALGNAANVSTTECQFADGNGYLFVFHPACDPFYCFLSAGVITAAAITLQVRDFAGISENIVGGIPAFVDNKNRPASLTNEHNYNLQNQGWTSSPSWSATSSTNYPSNNGSGLPLGSVNMTIQTGLTISLGTAVTLTQTVFIVGYHITGYYQVTNSGTITAYNGGTGAATFNLGVGSRWNGIDGGGVVTFSSINSVNTSLISTWLSQVGNYPANSDVWWTFKDSTGVFHPANTLANITQNIVPAPKGAFVLPAFNLNRTAASGVPGLTTVFTTVRPETGAWFSGRVWYTGVNASQPPSGDETFFSWTENIYFSTIVQSPADFGSCFQQNDPTSGDLFNILPSDGGIIVIQGSGAIYKLMPVQNGLLVFAANGIWFITGGAGIGFTATDYTVTKISNVQSISSTSYINVQGTIFFWNEEGIYSVSTQVQQGQAPMGQAFGGFAVTNICLGTILTFYQQIPLQSKKFARGDYNPITYVLNWLYRTTNESGIANRYSFDGILNLNTVHSAFYPYQVQGTTPTLCGVNYVAGPGGSTSPSPVTKYFTQYPQAGNVVFTFSQEQDNTNWVDFHTYDGVGVQYISTFTAGYNIHSSALTKWRPEYVYIFSRHNVPMKYQVQGVFQYASNSNSGKFSNAQIATLPNPITFSNGLAPPPDTNDYGMIYRRHRLRGNGLAFQLLITSVPGQPFDIMGWSLFESRNASV